MKTTVLFVIIALALILTVIGEIWGTDKGKFWNYPFKTYFESKFKQAIYQVCWVILIIALWADLIAMFNSILSGFGWLWMILIIPAAPFGLFLAAIGIAIAIVILLTGLKALFSKLDF